MVNKFLLSALMCSGIIGTANSMEQSVDLSYVLKTCPDQIAGHLDGKSFSSLTQVCSLFEAICKGIPTKYLAIAFSDVADHGNNNLIDRFIAKPDLWMFESEMNEKFISGLVEINGDNFIEIFERPFGSGLQGFLGDCAMYRIIHNDVTVRYLLFWQDSEKIRNNAKRLCVMYLNVGECDNKVNMVSRPSYPYIAEDPFWPYFATKAGYGGCHWEHYNGRSFSYRERKFALEGSSDTAESLFKNFGMLAIFILAAQKNNTAVVSGILNNPIVFDSLPSDVLDVAMYDLNSSDEIKGAVLAAFLKRNMAVWNIAQ